MIYLDKRESAILADSFLYYRNPNDKGYNLPEVGNEIVLTQSAEVFDVYTKKGYNVKFLSEYLGLKGDLGLYEVFSHFFDGKVQTDFDMIEALFNGMLISSDWCFCLKIGVSFCWFKLSDNKIIKLGKMQFSEQVSKYTVGKFIKRLRYSIVKSGVNLNKLKFLVWNSEDLDNEFKNYILKFDYLEIFFSKIEGLSGLSIENIMHLLSNNLQIKYQVTAENFIDCLNSSFKTLGLVQKSGVLYSRNVYYKDFSICNSPIINTKYCSYGIILDCEGVSGCDGSLENGCSSIGGLIYCKYQNILLSVDTFMCDNVLLEDTLVRVINNFRSFSQGIINVITFGSSDEVMLKSSISNSFLKKSLFGFRTGFSFIDAKPFIHKYLSELSCDVDGKYTLSNIAKTLNVLPVYPKHDPTNDARTLFNILAKILMTTGDFVV